MELRLDPAQFSCSQYGEVAPVTLTVEDPSGNVDSCSTFVSIAPLPPEPSASSNVCGGDTLLLFANPPTEAAPGQTIYTYRWFDPAGNLISTAENPIIPGVDQSNDGAYRVEIRGLSGCSSEGVVFVAIGEIPEEPFIEGPDRVCIGDEVPLTTSSTYAGSVSYEWYRGVLGNSELLGTSITNSFSAPMADGATSGQFFARAIVNGCASPPSNRLTVGTTQRPDAAVDSAAIEACAFSDVTLSAVLMPGLDYEWTGPNDFFATGRVVVIEDIIPSAAGTYSLRTIRDGGCYSLPASIEVSLLPADDAGLIFGTDIVCPQDTLRLAALDDTGVSYIFEGPNGQEIETTESSINIAPVTEDFAGEWRMRILKDICYSAPSDPLFVSIATAPEATASIIPDPICVGNDLILQGASNLAGSSYRWEGPNGFAEASIAPVIPDVTEESNGTYILTVTSASGCSANDTLEIDVLPGLRVDSIIVSSGQCLIGGEPVSLSAVITPAPTPDDVYTYQWTGPEGTSSNFFFEIPSVSLASNGQYSLAVMNETGCRSPEFVTPVEFDFAPSAPTMPFSPDGVYELCAGEDLALQTNDFGEGVTYLWRLGDGTNIPTTSNSLTIRDIQGAFTGFFSVRVIRNNCTSMPSMGREITITDFPALSLTATSPACSGQAIDFQITDIAGANYSWMGPNNFSSSLPNPTIVSADNAVHAGEYSVVVDLNGCLSDTMRTDINVLPTPRVPVAQPINPICIGDPDAVLELRVNPNTDTEGAQYAWFIQNGQTPVGEPTEDLLLNVTDFSIFAGGGLFDFAVRTIVDGCESALSTPITVRLDDIGNSVADAGRDTVICAGLFLLEAGPINSGSGRWTLVQGTGDITIANPGSRLTAVQGLTEFGGPYEFAWTLSEGSCADYASDTITLTVTDGEEAIAGDNFLICAGDETRLDATPTMMNGSGGRWTQGLAQEILGVVIEEPTNPNTLLTGLQPDNVYSFTWTVTSNCGVKSDNVLVNVSDPTPFAGEDFTVCNGERSSPLAAASPTIGSAGRWLADDGVLSFSDPESPTSTVFGLRNGENLLVWEVDDGFCGDRSRDTVLVFYTEPSQPRDDTYDVNFQGTITFDPSENDINPPNSIISFLGMPPDGGILTDNNDGTFTFQVPPNYVGEIALDYEVLSDDCSAASATVFVRIGKDVSCEAPNIFTPNGDNMNDFFVVPCLLDVNSFPESQVTIYNQWGDEVYRSGKPYRNDWDGTYQGSNLPVATYFYIINFGGARESESGDVRIER
ncbi:MAG: gliding motility-associated C-terminal domain-containing protein [Bacteroidota bacterium]